MHKDWNTIARDLTGLMSRLRRDNPDVGTAFAGLATPTGADCDSL